MIADARTGRRLTPALDERGVALAAAVFTLAVIGALVASSFFAGRLEQQSGQNILFAAQAREAAEAGLSQSLAEIPAATLESLPVGGTPLDLGTSVVGQGVTVRCRITRLTSRVFLIRADGHRGDPAGPTLATRSLGLLVRLPAPSTMEPSEIPAAVTPLAERGWVHLY